MINFFIGMIFMWYIHPLIKVTQNQLIILISKNINKENKNELKSTKIGFRLNRNE